MTFPTLRAFGLSKATSSTQRGGQLLRRRWGPAGRHSIAPVEVLIAQSTRLTTPLDQSSPKMGVPSQFETKTLSTLSTEIAKLEAGHSVLFRGVKHACRDHGSYTKQML